MWSLTNNIIHAVTVIMRTIMGQVVCIIYIAIDIYKRKLDGQNCFVNKDQECRMGLTRLTHSSPNLRLPVIPVSIYVYVRTTYNLWSSLVTVI